MNGLELVSYDVISLSNVIVVIKKQMTIGSPFSATSPADLLYIIFNAFGHVNVNNTLKMGKI